ncbi:MULTISPECIES: phage integrase SAM-like domain-containing protein [unclassified Sphingobacterium]|uniref:phage integrase SAM-like domain-containing protein n=1 Tax=unclassified Sphingobacterium TaxID=2609468 RepID=UPI0025F998D5|nr:MULTISPECIES: phage integrase SAM-like domain-containing protein [unclassified Sphingobacterium]
MATLSAVILDHHIKSNKTVNVKIRIGQHGQSVYIATDLYTDRRNIDARGKLKPAYVDKYISPILNKFRDYLTQEISKSYSAQRIKEYILKKEEPVQAAEDIDFLAFCNDHIEELVKDGRSSSAVPLRSVVNSLTDYFKGMLNPAMLTSKILIAYETYLRNDRTLVRTNQHGKKVKIVSSGMTDAGVFKHMANLRILFNACKFKYNDEDIGEIIIRNNPFVKYKLKPTRNKKKRNAEVDLLIKLYTYQPVGRRERLAKDMFFLSFFLCGINAVDIYKSDMTPISGRLGYNRSKTQGKRDDSAFISIAVPDVAAAYFKEYRGTIAKRYSDARNFTKALNIGLKQIGEKLGFMLTFYSARHSFATVARNDCRCTKDDIADALNHVVNGMAMTDGYLAKDWSIVDEVQSKVLKFFFDKLNESFKLTFYLH